MLPAHQRPQSFEEETANGVSHGIALVACLVATPFLLISASRVGGAWSAAGAGIFAGATILMYLSSTLYPFLPDNRAKRVFRVLDHGAIFLLIAGTYTPFTFGILRGAWGWMLFGLVWSMAIGDVGLAAWFQIGGTPCLRKNCAGFVIEANATRADRIKQEFGPRLNDIFGKKIGGLRPRRDGRKRFHVRQSKEERA